MKKESLTIPVILASDDKYAPYLCVTLYSILANSNKNDFYDLNILDNGISEKNKKRIEKSLKEYKNKKLIYIKTEEYIKKLDFIEYNPRYTYTTYLRLFIPQIFSKYPKIIYLDCDLIVNQDLHELYTTNLHNHALAACQDYFCFTETKSDPEWNNYVVEKIKLSKVEDYFNAGVLIMDITKLKAMNFDKKCFEVLQDVNSFKYLDQCTLNILFRNDYQKLDFKWNVQWHAWACDVTINKEYSAKIQKLKDNPGIIHYISTSKAWTHPEKEGADYFWENARHTAFYEEIIYTNLKHFSLFSIDRLANFSTVRNIAQYSKNRFNYYRCQFLASVTFGKLKHHYQEKKKILKSKIKDVRLFLKGK